MDSTNIKITSTLLVNPFIQNHVTVFEPEIKILYFKYAINSIINSRIPNYSQFELKALISSEDYQNMNDFVLLLKLNITVGNKNYSTIVVPFKTKILKTDAAYGDKLLVSIIGTGYFSWRLLQENNLKLLFSAGFSRSGILPENVQFSKNLYNFLKQTIPGFLKTYYGDFNFQFRNNKASNASTIIENIILPNASNNYEIILEYLKQYNPILGYPLFWIDDIVTMTINFDELITSVYDKDYKIVREPSSAINFTVDDKINDGVSTFEFFKKHVADYIIKNFNNVKILKNKNKGSVFIYKNRNFENVFVSDLYTTEIPYTINDYDLKVLSKLTEKVCYNANVNSYKFYLMPVLNLEKFNVGDIISVNLKPDLDNTSTIYITGTETEFTLNQTQFDSAQVFDYNFKAKKLLKGIDISSISTEKI